MGKKEDQAFIAKLKAQPDRGSRIPIGESGQFARLDLPSRDEIIFYQEGDRALLFETEALYDKALAMRKIKRWDNNDNVTDEERAAIVRRIADHLRNHGWTNPPPGWKE